MTPDFQFYPPAANIGSVGYFDSGLNHEFSDCVLDPGQSKSVSHFQFLVDRLSWDIKGFEHLIYIDGFTQDDLQVRLGVVAADRFMNAALKFGMLEEKKNPSATEKVTVYEKPQQITVHPGGLAQIDFAFSDITLVRPMPKKYVLIPQIIQVGPTS